MKWNGISDRESKRVVSIRKRSETQIIEALKLVEAGQTSREARASLATPARPANERHGAVGNTLAIEKRTRE